MGAEPEAVCFHCGADCGGQALRQDGRSFCCQGCLAVYGLLTQHGLAQFYDLQAHAGVRQAPATTPDRFACLDEPALQRQLLDFADPRQSRVTFQVPAIHCLACVWLLENLCRFRSGIGRAQVNFLRREVSVSFVPEEVRLSEVAALLAALGYAPLLTLASRGQTGGDPRQRRLYLQLGVAGFAFGNIMLLSFPGYLGLGSLAGVELSKVLGALSWLLALPVLVYSAADYWQAAGRCVRRGVVTIEAPLAAGLAALFAQSTVECLAGRGPGYLDSLVGLVFFLLCGKWFQQKTHARLAFDRDYRDFFPLTVTRQRGALEEVLAATQLRPGDRVVLRHGELLPADGTLVKGLGHLDYAFVTGEAAPVAVTPGASLYAGGRQMGGRIEVQVVKPVSQSYLAGLWENAAFHPPAERDLRSLTDGIGRYFTWVVMSLAAGTALGWWWVAPARALPAFAAVLIVACPCALALAAPCALGTALRRLAAKGVYVRSGRVLERLGRVRTVVFDKTGTLTTAGTRSVQFVGQPLSAAERDWVGTLADHSIHPYCLRLSRLLATAPTGFPVSGFAEVPGAGVEGEAAGHRLRLGSAAWLAAGGVAVAATGPTDGSAVHVAIDGHYRGCYRLAEGLRPEAAALVADLGQHYNLALLSGDNPRERDQLRQLFGPTAPLRFEQSPLAKLGFIQKLQAAGEAVMMVGDGLNDAGALRQSDVGVAVVADYAAFSPASDVIITVDALRRLPAVLRYARSCRGVVYACFGVSVLYNLVGISLAIQGRLSPLTSAILMPLSSVTVVALASGLAAWHGRRVARGAQAEPRPPRRDPAPLATSL